MGSTMPTSAYFFLFCTHPPFWLNREQNWKIKLITGRILHKKQKHTGKENIQLHWRLKHHEKQAAYYLVPGPTTLFSYPLVQTLSYTNGRRRRWWWWWSTARDRGQSCQVRGVAKTTLSITWQLATAAELAHAFGPHTPMMVRGQLCPCLGRFCKHIRLISCSEQF